MLLKLIKHEFISSYRKYIPIYAVVLGVSLLTPLTYRIDHFSLIGIVSSALALIIGAMGIFTIYNLILSLGQRVYGNPGYLLFSLPVKTTDIIISKTIVNVIWVICTGLVALVAFSVFLSLITGASLFSVFDQTIGALFSNHPLLGIIYIAFGFVYIIYTIGFLMFIFALLNLIYKGEHKIVTGIILYFVLSNIIGLISIGVIGSFFGLTDILFINSQDILWMIGLYIIITAGLFYATYYMMDKKLDLQ
ncbi:MAG: hypothetical protein ABH890_06720 [Bacillota bacterium]